MYHPDPKLPAMLRGPAVEPGESSLRLDDLIGHRHQLPWQEAVAIVQALCALQVVGSATAAGAAKNQSTRQHVPDASRIWLTESGQIIADLGPHQVDAAVRAAWLLGELLTDPAVPAQLRLFQLEGASPSSRWSLRDFSHSLEPFERDHRSRLIRAAYRRWRETQRRMTQAQHAQATPSIPATESSTVTEEAIQRVSSPIDGPGASWRWLVPVAVGAAALGGAVVGATWWLTARPAAPRPGVVVASGGAQAPTLAPGAEAGAADGGGDRQPLPQVSLSSRPAAATVTGRTARAGAPQAVDSGSARAKASASGPKPALAPTRAVQDMNPSRNAPADRDPRSGARPAPREFPDARATRAGGVAPGDGTVRMVPSIRELGTEEAEVEARAVRPALYSAADRDVEPPVAVRQQLPTGLFETSRGDVASMDLWISETGEVLQVRLGPGTNRLAHAMLLSAAKTWRFKPATLRGRPVAYKLEQRWATTPQ